MLSAESLTVLQIPSAGLFSPECDLDPDHEVREQRPEARVFSREQGIIFYISHPLWRSSTPDILSNLNTAYGDIFHADYRQQD